MRRCERRFLSGLSLALALASPARADMYPDASNAVLPVARTNLGLGTIASSSVAVGNITVSTGINSLSITSDSVTSSGGPNAPNVYGFLATYKCCTATATNAARFAAGAEMLFNGQPSTSSTTNNYTASLAYAHTGLPVPSAGGGLEGSNDNVLLQTGATGWSQLVGHEIDVTAQEAPLIKAGLIVLQSSADSRQGSARDAAFLLENSSGAVGWRNVIYIDLNTGENPLNVNACLWCAAEGTATIATGLDWHNFTFTGNSLVLPGLVMGGVGKTLTVGAGTGQAHDANAVALMHAATNENLEVRGHSIIAAGIALEAVNDALSGIVPMEILSSNLTIQSGLTITGLPVSAGAGGVYVCQDSGGVLYRKASCP